MGHACGADASAFAKMADSLEEDGSDRARASADCHARRSVFRGLGISVSSSIRLGFGLSRESGLSGL